VFIGDHKSPIFGFLGWDRGDKRASRAPTPTRHLRAFCCKQRLLLQSMLGRPLRGPWVALGWPLGGPSITQSQTQSQSGRGSQIHQVPITTYQVPFLSKIVSPPPGQRAQETLLLQASYIVFCSLLSNHTQIHGSTAASGRRSLRMILVLHGH
jgi:hypothetical protein